MTTIAPRMGRIEYLNVLPLYHALETGLVPHGYELVYAPPSALNAMMEKGELAVSSTSSIEYARHPENYVILPDLGICSAGRVMSVLLLSRIPIEQLHDKTVLVSAQSHTSVALLRLLFARAGIAASFVTGNASEAMAGADAPAAAMIIGDEALKHRARPDYPYIWDLGEEWFTWTKLPFTFGLWVASRDAARKGLFREDPAAALHAGRDWTYANMEAFLDVAEARYPISRPTLREYFTCLYYTLGEAEQEGLRLFYDRLATAGIIAKAPDLVFWPLQ